jgi:F420-non-reducing hydrogenase iron-sulfur subunit
MRARAPERSDFVQPYEPKIVCFSCSFGWGYLLGNDVLSLRLKDWIPVFCSGKLDSTHILKAFKHGVDGVLILGCPDGDCHFQDGNYQTRKKVHLLRKVMVSFGIEPQRLRMELGVDPEGQTIAKLIDNMARDIRRLGPVKISDGQGVAASANHEPAATSRRREGKR